MRRRRVTSKKYVSHTVHHPGLGGVVVVLDALADDDHSCLRGCLVVQVSVENQLRQEGVVLCKLLVGDVRVACTHRFTRSAGIFRFSNVTLNMWASLVSGCKVRLVFDAPSIEVALCSPTPSDGCVDSVVQELDRILAEAVR